MKFFGLIGPLLPVRIPHLQYVSIQQGLVNLNLPVVEAGLDINDVLADTVVDEPVAVVVGAEAVP